MWVHVCMQMHVCICACACRGHMSTLGVITHKCSPDALRQYLLLVWSLLSRLGCTVSKPQGCACPHFPSAGIASVPALLSFQMGLRDQTQALMPSPSQPQENLVFIPPISILVHVFLLLLLEELTLHIKQEAFLFFRPQWN